MSVIGKFVFIDKHSSLIASFVVVQFLTSSGSDSSLSSSISATSGQNTGLKIQPSPSNTENIMRTSVGSKMHRTFSSIHPRAMNGTIMCMDQSEDSLEDELIQYRESSAPILRRRRAIT